MRIISKFRDYYDGVAGQYFDEKLTYVRKKEDLKHKTLNNFYHIENYLDLMPRGHFDNSADISRCVLGFCGKLYPIYYIEPQSGVGGFAPNVERMHEFIMRHLNSRRDIVDFQNFWERKGKHTLSYYEPLCENKIKTFYEENSGKKSIDLFFELKTPIFLYCDKKSQQYEPKNIYKNICLKDIGFQIIMDAHTTFQEIAMFIGGVLSNNNEPPQITDDKVLRDSKGFGDMSFKTVAPGKKPRGKNKKGGR